MHELPAVLLVDDRSENLLALEAVLEDDDRGREVLGHPAQDLPDGMEAASGGADDDQVAAAHVFRR